MAAPSLPQTMRAAQWTTTTGGLEKTLHLNPSAPLPKLAAALPKDHILVKVAYCTPNPIDFKVAEFAPFIFTKPATPCLDFSGVVAGVGADVGSVRVGEKVFGATQPPAFGAAAEYIVLPAKSVAAVPEGVELRDAACIGITGLTAYQCIRPYITPNTGAKIFINGGSGGTGTFGIQIAKALGCHVTTTCSGPNVSLCKSLGADVVIDYKTQDPITTLSRAGNQFDLIVDNVFANPALYWNAHHYLKPSAPFVTIAGSPTLGLVVEMLKVFLWPKVLGGGQRKFKFVSNAQDKEEYAVIAGWMAEGKVKVQVEREFGLDGTGEAFGRLKSGRVRGKLIVKVAEK